MTALREYALLEASGWYAETPDAAADEVLVTFGDATLTIQRFDETPLAHWPLASLATVDGPRALTLAPDADAPERLGLDDRLSRTGFAYIRHEDRFIGHLPVLQDVGPQAQEIHSLDVTTLDAQLDGFGARRPGRWRHRRCVDGLLEGTCQTAGVVLEPLRAIAPRTAACQEQHRGQREGQRRNAHEKLRECAGAQASSARQRSSHFARRSQSSGSFSFTQLPVSMPTSRSMSARLMASPHRKGRSSSSASMRRSPAR